MRFRPRTSRTVSGPALLLALAACAAPRTDGSAPASEGPRGSAIVITSERLQGASQSNLLEAIRSEVSAMRIGRRSGSCPEISFRGVKTFRGVQNAGVYVDGSAFADTCILDQIRVHEVSRVEVYPSGSTMRPGYRPDPNGLILVFTGPP